MDLASVIGLTLGVILILSAIAMGGSVNIFFDIPSVLITMGGTFAGILINYSLSDIFGLIKVVKNAFINKLPEPLEVIEQMVELSEIARKEGFLALESVDLRIKDKFLAQGVQFIVDHYEPENVREMLETDIAFLQKRHALGQRILATMASLAPAFGMIGTLIGLIQMLKNLDSPDKIGPGMAVALLTSLYGALWANLICNPLAGKLEMRSEQEVFVKLLMVEGLLAIQDGESPRLIREKLYRFLAPKKREEPPDPGQVHGVDQSESEDSLYESITA
ncbi:MAG TPA: motility protein A [Firmicutes bacterium]|nr:motility protein A [Bacillota bacterium]